MIINNQTLVLSKRREKTKIQGYPRGHLGRDAIDELYNQKFKKFLYYCWIQSCIIPRYNISSHKIGSFFKLQQVIVCYTHLLPT
jgi:hypothetical protein